MLMGRAERNYSYTVILETETDPEFAGYYNARVLAPVGCFSYGALEEEGLISREGTRPSPTKCGPYLARDG